MHVERVDVPRCQWFKQKAHFASVAPVLIFWETMHLSSGDSPGQSVSPVISREKPNCLFIKDISSSVTEVWDSSPASPVCRVISPLHTRQVNVSQRETNTSETHDNVGFILLNLFSACSGLWFALSFLWCGFISMLATIRPNAVSSYSSSLSWSSFLSLSHTASSSGIFSSSCHCAHGWEGGNGLIKQMRL